MSRLPTVRDGQLRSAPDATPVTVGAPPWFTWLLQARSFTFASAAGPFTARHEERSGRRFWYAYRQRDGVLHKVYLGRSADLTLDRLERAADALARADVGDGAKAALSASANAGSSPLIATKISRPQAGHPLVPRPALVARCLDCVEHPCAILTAPAGFGKTTLLLVACDQLTRDRGWQVGWVSLEETEQDPVRFWQYVLAAIDSARPGVGVPARRLLERPRPLPIETVLTALINTLATTETPVALVLDDYHRAATPATDHGLAFLVEHMPPALHLVLATRADPALPLVRLRAQGRLGELHAADLRFSPDEASRFMRDIMRIALPDDQVARIEARTEGWVAGLQLAALSLRDHPGVPDPLADSAAPPRYIAEYLIGEVLDHQPPDVQSFLLQTAPLERLSGPLCDAVTGRSDSAAMLARLTQAQLFVTPLDAGQSWYRYHHLFAEVLCERRRRTSPEALEQSHRRAAAWLRQQGMIDEASRHLIAARAFDDAATLIEGESDRLVLRGEIAGLVARARALPREVILAHPHLCVLFAAGMLLAGTGAEAGAWLDDLERRLRDLGAPPGDIEGEIAVVRAILLLVAGDAAGGMALARDALMRLRPENHLMRGLALWITNMLGVFGQVDLTETDLAMAAIAEESLQAGNLLVAFMALATQASIQLYQCRLHRAAQTSREALRLVPQVDGQMLPIGALAMCVLGEIQREWNDLDGAEAILRDALVIGMHPNSAEFLMDGLIALAMVQAARGQGEEALTTFENVRHHIQVNQLSPFDLVQMEIMRVRVLIAQGRLIEAVRWADACQRSREERSSRADLPVLREMEDLALARVALAQGRTREVLDPLELICERAASTGHLRNVLEARMLLARARWTCGEREAALRDLDASLALAAPEGFVRMFVDEGEQVADLLASYVASRPSSRERAHALKLLAAFGRAVEPGEPAAPQVPVALSARELDVLRLLATGRSNEAIACELIIALSTVKWHVAHIYRKLGATGRVQAVARARELRLIA